MPTILIVPCANVLEQTGARTRIHTVRGHMHACTTHSTIHPYWLSSCANLRTHAIHIIIKRNWKRKKREMISTFHSIINNRCTMMAIKWEIYCNQLCAHQLTQNIRNSMHLNVTDSKRAVRIYPANVCARTSHWFKTEAFDHVHVHRMA